MTPSTRRTLCLFMLVEAASFVTAASIHAGLLMHGGEHRRAAIAESVIAAVLFIALAFSAIRPASTRGLSLAAQAFALLGTLVGIFTILIGIGPRTVPDVVYHLAIVTVLVAGLVVAARARPAVHAGQPTTHTTH